MRPVWLCMLLILLVMGCATEEQDMCTAAVQLHVCPQDDCEGILSKQILEADRSIHCAFWDIEEGPVSEALEQRRGQIDVNIVLDHRTSHVIPGISIVVNYSRYMHHKFCVIDGKKVTTGSYNPTFNGAFLNNNNLIVIEDEEIAGVYQQEHLRLSAGENAEGIATSCDARVTAAMCRSADCRSAILSQIEKAGESVRGMAFSLTDPQLVRLLAYKSLAGTDIRLLLESRNRKDAPLEFLETEDISVTLDTNPNSMHHKTFVIDNRTLISGSANPTRSGFGKNDENVVIIRDKSIAGRMAAEFDALAATKRGCEGSDVMLESALPNPKGRDAGNEFAAIINPGEDVVSLRGWSLSNGKRNMRLSGILRPGEVLGIALEGSWLRNTNGSLTLRQGNLAVDEAFWETIGEGDCVRRQKHQKSCSTAEWGLDVGCATTKTFLKRGPSP